MKLSVPKMGYIFLSCWSKSSQRLPQTLQAIADAISYPLQSYCLTHHRLLFSKMEKRGWYSNESFIPTGYYCTGGHPHQILSVVTPENYNNNLPLKYACRCKGAMNVRGEINRFF